MALGATAAISAVSFVMVPGWWADWLAFLRATADGDSHQQPLLRIGLAALLVMWGPRTDRAWTVAVGVVLAMPVIYIHTLAMLLAVPWTNRYAAGNARAVTGPSKIMAP